MFRNLINQKYPNIKFKKKLKKSKILRTMFPRGRRKVPFKQLSFFSFEKIHKTYIDLDLYLGISLLLENLKF